MQTTENNFTLKMNKDFSFNLNETDATKPEKYMCDCYNSNLHMSLVFMDSRNNITKDVYYLHNLPITPFMTKLLDGT